MQTADDVRSLEPGKSVERLLAGGETHSYRITLAAGQFSHAVVNQRGIDLVVAFYGLDGRKLVEIDNPNDVNGPEPISWIAEASGSYRLEVRSLSNDAPAGRYEVRVEELRTATPQDERRIAAQKAFTDAKSLRNLWTAESQRDAIEKYKQALVLWQSLADRLMAANSLHEMGFIYGDLGEYQKALDSYAQARELYNAMGDLWGEGGVLNNIGWVYGTLGEHQKAIDFYTQSLQASRATGLPHDESRILSNIGAEHASLGEYQKALDIHLQLLAVRQARNDSRGQAITLNNIANCYDHLGDKQKALDYYVKALNRMPAVGDAFYTATTLNNMGSLYRDLGEHQKALDYLNQALLLRRTVGDRNGEAATLAAIARLERDRGNLGEALNSIGAALNAVETLRTNVASQQLRASFFASVARYREFNIDLLMRRHKQRPLEGFDAAAFEASEKGRARSLLELLAEASAEIRQGVDPVLLERERTLRQTISDKAERQMRLLSGKHTEEQATAVSREINALTTEYEQIQGRIRETSPRYAALTQPVPLGLKEIQQRVLDVETLLLEYSLGEEKSFLWAVTPSGIKSFELPKRKEIEEAARRVYELLIARNQDIPNETLERRRHRLDQADAEYPKASAALSQMLLGPVAADLKNKRLLIVSDGVLQYVPFAGLPSPLAADSHPLVVDNEIVSLPSASVVAGLRQETAKRNPAGKTVAVLADPVFSSDDPRVPSSGKRRGAAGEETSLAQDAKRSASEAGLADLKRLRFSRQEADEIMLLVPDKMKLEAVDFAANRTLATSAELGQYRIVHFATHGLINNEHPELSGVVLSLVDDRGHQQNGFLRLYDLYNLKLSADLVVLSACRTALGKEIKGEGLVGLTRGFMYAGAPRVMASLWQIDDRAAAELMKRFYQGMLGQGLRAAAALRAAQISMQSDKRWRAPHYWAAFTIQGEWK
ncbi:MAG TPA: CHAT domain-containing protein [Blastocatellia bacterium]|nr:CHAT domain-containing protein [Blastocatellia bacterium]